MRLRVDADPVTRVTCVFATAVPQLPARTAYGAVLCRVVPSPASLPPARSALCASFGGAGRVARCASCPMSLRSIDRPSLPRRFASLMLAARDVRLVVSCRPTRCVESLERCARESRYLQAPESCQQNPFSRAGNLCARCFAVAKKTRIARDDVRSVAMRWHECGEDAARGAVHRGTADDAARRARRHREAPARRSMPRGGSGDQPRCAIGTTGRCAGPV